MSNKVANLPSLRTQIRKGLEFGAIAIDAKKKKKSCTTLSEPPVILYFEQKRKQLQVNFKS